MKNSYEHYDPEKKDDRPAEEVGSMVERTDDPLEEWRTNKEGRPMSKSYSDEEGKIILNEDEETVNENEKRWWTDVEEVADQDYLGILLDGNVSPDIVSELEKLEELEEENNSSKSKYNESIEDSDDEKVLLYSPRELALMEQCIAFKKSIDLHKKMEVERPRWPKGQQLDDYQMAHQMAIWKECEKNKSWGSLKQDEIEFIRKCVAWDKYYQMVLRNEKNRPTFYDGTPISDENVEQMTEDYRLFKENQPDEFAELKYEKGEWEKENLVWKEEEYRGKMQWVAYKSEDNEDYSKTEIKYVSDKVPPDGSGDFFFKINSKHETKFRNGNDGVLYFIDIKYPTSESIISEYKPKRRMRTKKEPV